MEKNIETLLHNLPDYIAGNLDDEGLKDRITTEINSNPVFRAEYESMKSTFAFLGENSLSEPPEFYFNNLVPTINKRIDAIEASRDNVFTEKFGWLVNVLKFAIPALILVLGYLLYTEITSTDREIMTEDEPNEKQEQIEQQSPMNNGNELSNVDNTTDSNNSGTPMDYSSSDRDVRGTATARTNENSGSSAIINNNNTDDIEDILTESASYPVINEEYDDETYQNLDASEQNEILNYLENAQL